MSPLGMRIATGGLLFASVTILLIGVVGFIGRTQPVASAAQDETMEELPPTLVVTAEVIAGPVTEEVTLVGTVQPVLDSLIASEIEGRVLEQPVEVGDRVEAQTPLAVLDATRLQRYLTATQAEHEEVKARLALARTQEQRARDLRDEEIVAERLMDEAVAERKALESQQAQVEARLASIQDDLERSVIRAPFTGVVTETHFEIGEWIEQGDPVVRLADLDRIEISLDVPERYFPSLRKGDAAPARLDALPTVQIEGIIHAIVPRADSSARTFPVLVRAPNPERQVGAGMLARVRLVLSSSNQVTQVPKDAVVQQGTGEVVYLVQGDTVRLVTVRTGRANGSHIEVAGAVNPGDLVVVRGNERLQPGQKIRTSGSKGSPAGSH